MSIPTVPNISKMLTIKEVAESMGVHQRTIYRLAKGGKMPGFKFGGTWRFDPETIRQWINQEMLKNCTEVHN